EPSVERRSDRESGLPDDKEDTAAESDPGKKHYHSIRDRLLRPKSDDEEDHFSVNPIARQTASIKGSSVFPSPARFRLSSSDMRPYFHSVCLVFGVTLVHLLVISAFSPVNLEPAAPRPQIVLAPELLSLLEADAARLAEEEAAEAVRDATIKATALTGTEETN